MIEVPGVRYVKERARRQLFIAVDAVLLDLYVARPVHNQALLLLEKKKKKKKKKKNGIARRNSKSLTISLLRRILSPTRTLK